MCERESVRKSQRRRVNVVSHAAWSFLLLGSEERMCALSCWLACPAAGQCGSEKRKTGQVCPARKACVEEGERMLPCLFIVARGSDPSRTACNILIGRKYEFGTKTVKIFLRQTIIRNSFCYSLFLHFTGRIRWYSFPKWTFIFCAEAWQTNWINWAVNRPYCQQI